MSFNCKTIGFNPFIFTNAQWEYGINTIHSKVFYLIDIKITIFILIMNYFKDKLILKINLSYKD